MMDLNECKIKELEQQLSDSTHNSAIRELIEKYKELKSRWRKIQVTPVVSTSEIIEDLKSLKPRLMEKQNNG